jgi:hypothetical protein
MMGTRADRKATFGTQGHLELEKNVVPICLDRTDLPEPLIGFYIVDARKTYSGRHVRAFLGNG